MPDNLHHQNMIKDDLSPYADNQNMLTLSNYADNTNIVYIYTLILRDNKILFTSSSATKEERYSGEQISSFFDHYNDVDPRVFEIFNAKQRSFLEYTDQWGSFRSLFIPHYSKDGTLYLAVADLSTHKIQTLFNKIISRTLIFSILFLCFAYPMYWVSNQYINRKAKKLESQVQQKSIALIKNQQHLERVLQASNQASVEINVQTEDITVSAEYYALLNISNTDKKFTLQTWKDNLHFDDFDSTMATYQQGIRSGETITMEYRRKTADGNWLWLRTMCKVTEWDPQNKPLLMVGTVMDISQNKQNELVLKALAETGRTSDSNIFQLIVRELALSHNSCYAFIATVDGDLSQATTLALWNNTKFIDNISYSLADTPCEVILNESGVDFYPDNIQQLFPDDRMLVEMGARSYVGISLRDSNNNVLGIISIINDQPISENKQTAALLKTLAVRASIELERRKSEEKLILFSHIFRDSHEGILLVNNDDLIIDVNPTFCRNTGYSKNELLGQPAQIFRSVLHKYPLNFYENIHQSIAHNGRWQGEVWNKLKNGDESLSSVVITQITDENNNPTHCFILVNDITEKKQQQDALKFMAHYDALTQLPNRTLFGDRFNQAVAHSKRNDTLLAICFLDLDNFKPINDNYGHETGDQLLIEVAQRITAALREEDTVSRQGGDEFTLLLGSIKSFSQCKKMLIRILQSLAAPYSINNSTHTISASIGVTLYPLDDSDIDTLTRHADQAMYQAKQAGKNQYRLFDALTEQEESKKQQHHQELYHALQYDQFCLHYQPKVNMKTGKAFGVEALIRWQHPEKGLLFPLEFLPAAENTDLDHKIGAWVINTALSQLNKWLQQGIELEVSINISSSHLQSESFILQLQKSLAKYPDLNPQFLQLEILESSALGDITTISNIITTCQNTLGIRIALDDFGTGYSSLTHLRNLSAQTIKIDRSFVRDLLDDPNDFAIISGIIGLAGAFNREIIAEGVETTNHGLMLLAMGCDEAQGYGISRPMPAADLPSWIKNYIPNQQWIEFGNKILSPSKKQTEILKLTTERWFNNIKEIIESSDSATTHPTLTLCHLGTWVDQLRKTQLFKKSWLTKLHHSHNKLFTLAEATMEYYLAGKQDAATRELQHLHVTFNVLITILDDHK